MNVSLTHDLEQFVRDQVKSGMYNSASEVVRAALRLLVARANREPSTAYPNSGAAETHVHEGSPGGTSADNLRQALDLLRLAHALMEQNLRRDRPGASDAEVIAGLADWKAREHWGEEDPGYLERSPQRLERLRRGNA